MEEAKHVPHAFVNFAVGRVCAEAKSIQQSLAANGKNALRGLVSLLGLEFAGDCLKQKRGSETTAGR